MIPNICRVEKGLDLFKFDTKVSIKNSSAQTGNNTGSKTIAKL